VITHVETARKIDGGAIYLDNNTKITRPYWTIFFLHASLLFAKLP
jgi:hypothetical protein